MSLAETLAPTASADAMEKVRAALAAKPDGVIEAVAREHGVSTLAVLEATPNEQRRFIAAERFEALWQELSGWGTVLFIVHTPDIVLECEGSLPVGSFGHGYYNIHGDSPIGGHIKAGNCKAIYLVDRQFHGRRSCSVQFFNGAGEAMFKVFVRRDEARDLLADQVARFEALKASFG
ncbi:heme utilization protein HuvX [Bosea sp. Root483D1]|uniref:heme utilization cystosolic carrier protein HutX n=1 Tax=Bosea sp. Root483D1 TaxID=1736544 RepID=UPI000708F1F6|nr:heme utilization cystosolic carrier protein HutX [Bosea sp. Root483D1]KRE24672.1 heme utilization protein HuvX [Bosea sp. Root483D1]